MGSPNLRHAGALAIAVGASTILFRKLGLPNGYWMPMTVLIVLRSSFDDTVAFALARIGGTVAGAGFVTLAIALSRPSPPYLVLFQPQLRISLEMFVVEEDGGLSGSEGISDEAGGNMGHGVHG